MEMNFLWNFLMEGLNKDIRIRNSKELKVLLLKGDPIR